MKVKKIRDNGWIFYLLSLNRLKIILLWLQICLILKDL